MKSALNILSAAKFRYDESDTVMLLNSRFNRNEKEKRNGCMSDSDYRVENARITQSVLSLADSIIGESRNVISNSTIITGGDFRLGDNYGSPTVMLQSAEVIVNYWIIGGINCQDPEAFQKFITKERHGVATEYTEAIQFGNAVLSYTKDKFDERTFNTEFSPLRYAIEDLQSRQTLDRMKAVISQVQKHQDLILRFLKKEVKESLLEKMYNNANEDNGRSFLEKYEVFLKKYLEINSTADQKVYEKWLYDRNEFFEDAGANEEDLYFKSQLQGLRTKWLRKFRP